MEMPSTPTNPRLEILREEVERTVLKPFRTHRWTITDIREFERGDIIKISATKATEIIRIAVLYSSSGISKECYSTLAEEVDQIFFSGQSDRLDSFESGREISVEPLGYFFPFLVRINKLVEPDRSPIVPKRRSKKFKRLISENPLEVILTRLQQFTSVKLAATLVKKRAESEEVTLPHEVIDSKAMGVAYSMRSALDYITSSSTDRLNRRILSLYYGTMAFAQAEMLADPNGASNLAEVERMTDEAGHGLFAFRIPDEGFSGLRIGMLRNGFLPQWAKFLGYDINLYCPNKARSQEKFEKLPKFATCSLRDLFASMPEIADLFAEVFGGSPKWIMAWPDDEIDNSYSFYDGSAKKPESTYCIFHNRACGMTVATLEVAGWPLAEILPVEGFKGVGQAFRARVDHVGYDYWWEVMPVHNSPFGTQNTLLLPTIGRIREYRVIAAVTLYALSIMVRYMPSAWRRIEGGDEDHYLALVRASLTVWERVLPEHFLESIVGEGILTAQPGSFHA